MTTMRDRGVAASVMWSSGVGRWTGFHYDGVAKSREVRAWTKWGVMRKIRRERAVMARRGRHA